MQQQQTDPNLQQEIQKQVKQIHRHHVVKRGGYYPQAMSHSKQERLNSQERVRRIQAKLLQMDTDGLLRDFWNVRIWQAWLQFETEEGVPVQVEGRINLHFPQEFSNRDEKGAFHVFQRPHGVKCGVEYTVMFGKKHTRWPAMTEKETSTSRMLISSLNRL